MRRIIKRTVKVTRTIRWTIHWQAEASPGEPETPAAPDQLTGSATVGDAEAAPTQEVNDSEHIETDTPSQTDPSV